MSASPIELAICYAREDEDDLKKLFQQLRALERTGLIHMWYDREILAGSEYSGEIEQRLNSAQIILLIASAGFIASDYCYDTEMPRALVRQKSGLARVIAVLLHPCSWKDTPLSKQFILPTNKQPISDSAHWPNMHNALLNVNEGVKRLAHELQVLALLEQGEAFILPKRPLFRRPATYDEASKPFVEAIALVAAYEEQYAEPLVPSTILARLYQGKGDALFEARFNWHISTAEEALQEILDAYERASEHDLTLPDRSEQKARVFYELKNYEVAHFYVTKAIESGTTDSSLLFMGFDSLLHLVRVQEALAFYQQWYSKWTYNVAAHEKAAHLFEQQGNYEEALSAWERRLSAERLIVRPFTQDQQQYRARDADHYAYKASLLEHLQRYEEALAACEQALSLTPENDAFLLQKGLLLEILGRDKEALATLETIVNSSLPEWLVGIVGEGDSTKGLAYFGIQRLHEKLASRAAQMARISGHVPQLRLVRSWRVRNGAVSHLAFSPDGSTLATIGDGNDIILWNLRGQKIRSFPVSAWGIYCLAFSCDGRKIASGGGDKLLRLWDTSTGKLLQTLEDHNYSIICVAFHSDGYALVTGGSNLSWSKREDTILKLWDSASGKVLTTFRGHSRDVRCVAFSPDGRFILSGSDDQMLILWDSAGGQVVANLEEHIAPVEHVAFSRDGRFAVSSDTDGIKYWDLVTRQMLAAFNEPFISGIALHPAGRILISSSYSDWVTGKGARGNIKLRDLLNGREIQTLEQDVSSLALSQDGYTLVTGSQDGMVHVWHLQ
jgi:WD40 repeat protein